jgi:hypothetical protein
MTRLTWAIQARRAEKRLDSFSADERIMRSAVEKPLLRDCVQWCRLRQDRYAYIGNNFPTRFSRKTFSALLLQVVLPEVSCLKR